MLNNRKIEVKLVKNNQNSVESVEKPINVDDLAETVVTGAIVLIGAYMIGDTVRKCVCHAVTARMG